MSVGTISGSALGTCHFHGSHFPYPKNIPPCGFLVIHYTPRLYVDNKKPISLQMYAICLHLSKDTYITTQHYDGPDLTSGDFPTRTVKCRQNYIGGFPD